MQSSSEVELQLLVERLQIDNQAPHAALPVVLVGAPAARGGSGPGGPWLQANVSRRRGEKRVRQLLEKALELTIPPPPLSLHSFRVYL